MHLTLSDVSAAVGQHSELALPISGVSIDTRTLHSGSLFVAIRGTKVDGHDYLLIAKERGATAALVDSINPNVDLPQICVTNTVDALGLLANWVRKRMKPTVIGVTGSYGKTTTKDMIAAVHGHVSSCHATVGNFNTEIGLPLTILSAPDDTGTLVLEMGMRGAGQIAELVRISEPNIGVITTIGSAHIELLGSREAIATAKTELFRGLSNDSVAVFPSDIAYKQLVLESAQHCRHLIVGDTPDCDLCISDIQVGKIETKFDIKFHDIQTSATVASPARFAAMNGALAIATGLAAGHSLNDCVTGLANWRPSEGRMRPRHMANGAVVLSDAYNAAPEAMLAAISVLADIVSQTTGNSWAVLGEMRELGVETKQWHHSVGESVQVAGIDHLVVVGTPALGYKTGALMAGMNPESIHFFESPEVAATVLKPVIGPEDVVLVKGSRAASLDSIVDTLCEVTV